jgi:hypothetical protein
VIIDTVADAAESHPPRLIDGVDRTSNDPLDGAHRCAVAEEGEDLGALGEGQLVHARTYELFCLPARIKVH